jgi:hypothetical protein
MLKIPLKFGDDHWADAHIDGATVTIVPLKQYLFAPGENLILQLDSPLQREKTEDALKQFLIDDDKIKLYATLGWEIDGIKFVKKDDNYGVVDLDDVTWPDIGDAVPIFMITSFGQFMYIEKEDRWEELPPGTYQLFDKGIWKKIDHNP